MSSYHDKKDISNHAIGLYIKEGPKEFKLYLDGKLKDKDTEDLRMGTQVHSFLLEPESFWDKYFLQEESSTGMMNRLIEELAKLDWDAGNGYDKHVERLIPIIGLKYDLMRVLKELEKPENSRKLKDLIANRGKIPISQENYHIVESIKKSVGFHPTADRLINCTDGTVLKEAEVYWNNKEFNLPCKAKLDIVNIHPENGIIELCELKKTSKPLKYFEYEIKKYGYHRQLSWYIHEALPSLLDQYEIDPNRFTVQNRIIACQSYFPYNIRVIQLDEVDMIEGQREYNQALDRIKWHIDNDFWERKEYYGEKDWIDQVCLFTPRDEVTNDTEDRE